MTFAVGNTVELVKDIRNPTGQKRTYRKGKRGVVQRINDDGSLIVKLHHVLWCKLVKVEDVRKVEG